MNLRFGNLRLIPGPNKGRYPFCHSLLIEDRITAVIDPASDAEVLSKVREERGVEVAILSHYHEDHWMHLHLLPEAELWMPAADAPPFADLDLFMDWYGMTEPKEIKDWKAVLKTQFHFRERRPERQFSDHEVLEIGETRVTVLHTPGHTPGHCCFYFPDQELLFLADIDLTKFGPWYGDKYSDIDEFIASVARVRRIRAKTLITAHEEGVFAGDADELWDKYLGVIARREEKLKELLKEPRTIEEIVEARIVYGKPREPRSFYDFGERATMLKHLERMMRRKEVELKEGKYVLMS